MMKRIRLSYRNKTYKNETRLAFTGTVNKDEQDFTHCTRLNLVHYHKLINT
jgi:hypothetical protein